MPIQNVPMNWGTWLKSTDSYTPTHYADSYMRLGFDSGGTVECRPLIKFRDDGFSGQILSASIMLYCLSAGNSPACGGYKVNKSFATSAAWATPWDTAGCNHVSNDRSGTSLANGPRLSTTGWITIPVTDLTELLGVLNGLDAILLVGDSRDYATIDKATYPPYLAIEYKSSIVGGVQIF